MALQSFISDGDNQTRFLSLQLCQHLCALLSCYAHYYGHDHSRYMSSPTLAYIHCKCFRRKLHDVSQRSIPGTISVVLFTTDSSILQIVVLLLQYDKIVVLFTTYNSILRIVVLYSSTTRLSYFLLRIVVLKVRLHLLYDKYVVLLLQSSGN